MPSRRSLFDYAVGLLARRDYSTASLRRKLVERQDRRGRLGKEEPLEPEAIEAIVGGLVEMGYLDDERYADRWAENRRTRCGSTKIAAGLAAKGVDRDLIESKRKALAADDLVVAANIWRDKFGERPTDFADSNRQRRFLVSRGFSWETIETLFRIIAKDELDELLAGEAGEAR